MKAELRFANSMYVGVLLWIVVDASVFFYDANWSVRAPNTLTVSLNYASALMMLMTVLSQGVVHLWWRRIPPVRIQFRELLLSAAEGTPSSLSTLESFHA